MCENAAYLLRDDATEEIIDKIEIKQNDDGIDTEDRVKVLKRYITSMMNT